MIKLINCICIRITDSLPPPSTYFVEKMLFANSSDFPNVVDKADVSLCSSVALTNLDVPITVQKFSPDVSSQSIPHSQPDFMISVIVSLGGNEEHVTAVTEIINNKLHLEQ